MPLRLEPMTPDNVRAAIRLKVRPEQEDVVAPVVVSLAEAYASRETAWPRLRRPGRRGRGGPAGQRPDHRALAAAPPRA